jgi:putative endonuclease
MSKQPAVYIMANGFRGTIYGGVTSLLIQRGHEHKNGEKGGFTSKYGCKLRVWYELHETMESAILREKQIKSWKRAKKLALIEEQNPFWKDLYASLF